MSLGESGFKLLKSFFSEEEIKDLKILQNNSFPSYYSGLSDFGELSRDNPYFQEVYFDKQRRTRFDGVPLAHRIFRGEGSPNLNDNPNILYGKRASRRIMNLPEAYDKFIFNEKLLKEVSNCLEGDSIYFNLASANRVYPKFDGYSTLFHIDTYGFTQNVQTFTDKYLINMIIYINGTDSGRSGTRIFPGSHNWYHEKNQKVAKSLNLHPNLNRIHQRELYIELFTEKEVENMVSIEASAGDVLLFRSDLIHSIPKNNSKSLHRDVIIANFSDTNKFTKSYSEMEAKKIIKRINKVENLCFAYTKNNKSFLNTEKIKTTLRNSKKLFKKILSKYKDIKISFLRSKKDLKKLEILNLGAGPSFFQKDVISLDLNDAVEEIGSRTRRITDVDFDLSSDNPLPFLECKFKGIYTSHCVEHLTLDQSTRLFNECYRVLKSGGLLRIVVPSIKLYFEKYEKKDLSFFNWIRNKSVYKFDSWLRFIVREFAGPVVDDFEDEELLAEYKSRSLDEFIKYFNDLSNKCHDTNKNIPDIHKSGWTKEEMIKILENIGFSKAYVSERHKSNFPTFTKKSIFDNTRPEISIYIEAVK